MIQGLIERAITRPTQRDDPKAREAGASWATQRAEDAMDRAEAPRERHASREQQTRRRWMGNWVSTGQGEGRREPGKMFGQQPPRPKMPSLNPSQRQGLVKTAMERGTQPAGFGGGGYFAGRSGNTTHGMSDSNLSARLGSLYSTQAAKQSLAANNMDLHPGRRSY